MDKRFVIERVKCDLRNEIYDLMTHPGYHMLEKELTESLLNAHALYNSLRTFTVDFSIPSPEKEDRRQLFAYMLWREMNSKLGGFNFDRYKSFSSGDYENKLFYELIERSDFNWFCAEYETFRYLKNEPDFTDFVSSRQHRYLEDSISAIIKKNKVIPTVARAIAQDIVDALHLQEDYTYARPTEEQVLMRFEVTSENQVSAVSLCKIPFTGSESGFSAMIKRCTPTSDSFKLLLTDFGAIIRGS